MGELTAQLNLGRRLMPVTEAGHSAIKGRVTFRVQMRILLYSGSDARDPSALRSLTPMTVRTARLSAALLLAASLAAAPLSAQSVEYASGTMKFRVSSTTTGSQTTPAGSSSFEVGIEEKITVTLMKHAKDTVMATMTVDSIAIRSAGPALDLSKLMGAKYVSLVSPTGKFYSVKAPEGLDPQLSQLTDDIGKLLPTFRGNLAPGLSWTDTVSTKIRPMGLEVDRTTVSSYKVDGDTTIGGEKAFRIQRTASAKGTGSGSMQGSPVIMDMTGGSVGSFFITPKGTYLGGMSNDDALIKLTVIQQNMVVTIKQSGVKKVEPIK